MLNSLDLLIIVFMTLAAGTLLSLSLMFLLRNQTAKRVFFYVTSAIGLYVSAIGLRIGIGGWFPMQIAVGGLTALTCIGAIALDLIGKNKAKHARIARLLSAAALVIALINAIL